MDCHADVLIAGTGNSGEIYGFHLVGVDAQVRAIVAAVYGRYELIVSCPDAGIPYRYWRPSGEWYVRQGRTPGGYAEAWVLSGITRETELLKRQWEADTTKRRVLLAWDGHLARQLYNLLDQEEDIPLRPEWAGWLYEEFLRRGYPGMNMLQVWVAGPQNPARNLEAALVTWCSESFQKMVQEGLQRRLISLPVECRASGPLDGITDLSGYVERFGRPLLQKMLRELDPLHKPGETPPDPRLGELVRQPKGAQADAIQAVAACLRHHRACFLVGETGSGKTLMGLGAIHLHARGKPYRAYVQVPGHLLYKVCREIALTVPGARIHIIGRPSDREDDADGDLPPGVQWITAPQLVAEVRSGVRPRKPEAPEFYVVSRDRAKLGWFERPGAIWNDRKHVWRCPDCGAVLLDRPAEKRGEQELDAVPLGADAFREHRKKNHRCQECGAILWQADGGRVRRAAPAWVLKKLGRWFHFAVLDEMHELKGKETAQGWTAAAAASFSRKLVLQTGTLVGGYASHLWALLWRTVPYLMVRQGFRWKDERAFVEQYGVLETVTRTDGDDRYKKSSRGREGRVTVRERPGISPLLYTQVLLGVSVFVQLSDVASDLPPYTEQVELVEPDPDVKDGYRWVESKFRELMGDLAGARKFAGAYVNTAMAWPDRPWEQPPVLDPEAKVPVITLPELPKDRLLAKERRLVEVVRQELAAGRKVLVYVQFTGHRDVSQRVQEVLQGAGVRVECLTAAVSPEKREGWLREALRRGVQVVITHPKLVETGLDLLEFPSIVFYQTGYNLFTLRQASRRSWRIGQEKPVRVYFLAYRGTIQETALALMGRKLEAALSLEGKWSEEGLAALAAGDSLTGMLVKALREGLENVEAADAIWRRMYREEAVQAVAPAVHATGESATEPAPAATSQPQVVVVTLAELARAAGRKKKVLVAERQLAFAL